MIVPPRTAKIMMRINKRPDSFGLRDIWFPPLRLFSYIHMNKTSQRKACPSARTRPFKKPRLVRSRETADVGDMARILQKRCAKKCMLYDRTNMLGEKKGKQRVKILAACLFGFMRRVT